MKRFDSPLQNIKIASPCDSNWDEMFGDDRRRFCSSCSLNVYNLSGMTRDEAESLIANAEGRVCVRFFRRADGSVITSDCPVGLKRIKKATHQITIAFGSLLVTFFTNIFLVTIFSKKTPSFGNMLNPITVSDPEPIMGAIAYVPDRSNAGPKIPISKFEMGKMVALSENGEVHR